MIDLVIFDCDGVLVDSEMISATSFARALTQFGHPIDAETIATRFLGMSYKAAHAALEQESGRIIPAEFEAALHADIFARYATELTAIPFVLDAVAAMDRAICVASSGAHDKIKTALERVSLYDRFAPHIFSAKDVARGKPAPDLFLLASERMKVAPDRCLVIEDSAAGVTAARAAGMTAFGFYGGSHCRDGHADKLHLAGAEVVFRDMRQLAGLVNARTGPKSPV